MEKNKRVYFLATLYALIIGFSFLFTKIALRYADPIDI
ncbi:MAG: EamA family transporter, partial [Tissierellia bacterium]|nr:EamA family transporter [Tissierellia bacterium]